MRWSASPISLKAVTLSGWENPADAAKQILALETEIAKVSWTRAERRDDDKTYTVIRPFRGRTS